jgi:hypothetical protein
MLPGGNKSAGVLFLVIVAVRRRACDVEFTTVAMQSGMAAASPDMPRDGRVLLNRRCRSPFSNRYGLPSLNSLPFCR